MRSFRKVVVYLDQAVAPTCIQLLRWRCRLTASPSESEQTMKNNQSPRVCKRAVVVVGCMCGLGSTQLNTIVSICLCPCPPNGRRGEARMAIVVVKPGSCQERGAGGTTASGALTEKRPLAHKNKSRYARIHLPISFPKFDPRQVELNAVIRLCCASGTSTRADPRGRGARGTELC